MSRTITGSTQFRAGVWQVLATQQDGSRKWFLMPGIPEHDATTAKVVGAAIARKVRRGEFVPGDRGETVGEYARRWCDSREKKGHASHDEDRSVIRNYVDPTIGALPIESIKPEHLRTFVAGLDARVQEQKIKPKRALNVWGVVRKMFKDAASSKIDDLRVLDANPAATVAAPDRATEKTRLQYLYPSEFLTLVASGAVPVWRARLYAWSVYVWARAGETAANTWGEVDLDRNVIRLFESVDRSRRPGERGTTKTGTERVVPIEPNLRPMLEAMRADWFHDPKRPPGASVFPVMPRVDGESGLAATLRRDLLAAGVTREDLFTASATRQRLRFHDLRATGITWAAVRGDKPLEIQQRAGHSTFKMTEVYIREAAVYSRPGVAFGEPFPELPARLLGDVPAEGEGSGEPYTNRTIVQTTSETPGNSWAQQGLNPSRQAGESPRKAANGRESDPGKRTTGDRSQPSEIIGLPGFASELEKIGINPRRSAVSATHGIGGGRVRVETPDGVVVSTDVEDGESPRAIAERLAFGLRQKGVDAGVIGSKLIGGGRS